MNLTPTERKVYDEIGRSSPTTGDLAIFLYGENDESTRRNVYKIINSLRAKNVPITKGHGHNAPYSLPQATHRGAYTTHTVEVTPDHFARVRCNIKRFDLRPADQGYYVGDTLRMVEVCPVKGTTGNILYVDILYIQSNLPQGLCALSLGEPFGFITKRGTP